eukprot:COSAG04_NODE_25822_length_303_cov_0.509804_1_plen_31_part_10
MAYDEELELQTWPLPATQQLSTLHSTAHEIE